MSRKYTRTTLRASWSTEDLDEAMRCVRSKEMGVNEASRNFKIPSRTLRRHLKSGKSKGPLGRKPVFSAEYEKKLVSHIKKLEKVGFAPERKDVKEMAFQLAKKCNIKNPFSENSESAGNVWFSGFMTRNMELSQRKSEGLSLSRAYGVNRKDVQEFFDLLAKIYEENDFANHPEDIYNMDESGIQVNNKPSKVVATKGAKDVYTLTSSEKGENVTVIACVNAQGNFLPPVLIYKGTYVKPQFSEGLPPGSQVFMNKKSSYINTDLFMKWFEEVFLRHKSPRKTLLILDGHSSHSNNIRLLEVAKENDVILLCLPSHTTHALQPLDRAFFRPLKVYFAQEAKSWMVGNKDKKLTRYDVSKLIGKAWSKAGTISNGVSALKSCGIFPYDPSAIPDHYFSLSDSLQDQNLVKRVQVDEDETSTESISILSGDNNSALTENIFETRVTTTSPQHVETELNFPDIQAPKHSLPSNINFYEFEPGPSALNPTQTPEKINVLIESQNTPSKILTAIHPVPKLPVIFSNKKQKAVILTSPENIEKRKLLDNKKKLKPQTKNNLQTKNMKKRKASLIKNTKTKDTYRTKTEKYCAKKTRKGAVNNRNKKKVKYSSSSESNAENDDMTDNSEEEISDEDLNKCVECTENYYKTQSTEDWILCISCSAWMHEFCTMYNPLCNRCGRKAKREAVQK